MTDKELIVYLKRQIESAQLTAKYWDGSVARWVERLADEWLKQIEKQTKGTKE